MHVIIPIYSSTVENNGSRNVAVINNSLVYMYMYKGCDQPEQGECCLITTVMANCSSDLCGYSSENIVIYDCGVN